jgi:hypothetical protein
MFKHMLGCPDDRLLGSHKKKWRPIRAASWIFHFTMHPPEFFPNFQDFCEMKVVEKTRSAVLEHKQIQIITKNQSQHDLHLGCPM